ncbi:hypothetical protein FVE85_5049 [Porphyridium purpureum]|uniref:Uncharacterized protein n=1 Tax=Porphyridium purpureum TaxID=35688 RepID=A0A5J4YID5_PORPP|nr:hypothetical protein FVE85_5049 [Porphyridium purpureum]|eukprot:POR5691..scf237_24
MGSRKIDITKVCHVAFMLMVIGRACAAPAFRDAMSTRCDTCEALGTCLSAGSEMCEELNDYFASVVQDGNTLMRVRVTSFMQPGRPEQCDVRVGRTFRLTLDDGFVLLQAPVMQVHCESCKDTSNLLHHVHTATDGRFVLALEPDSYLLPRVPRFKHLTNVPSKDNPAKQVFHKWTRDDSLYYSLLSLNIEDDDVLIVTEFVDFWHCDPVGYKQFQDFLIGRLYSHKEITHHGLEIIPLTNRKKKQDIISKCQDFELILDSKGSKIGCLTALD